MYTVALHRNVAALFGSTFWSQPMILYGLLDSVHFSFPTLGLDVALFKETAPLREASGLCALSS